MGIKDVAQGALLQSALTEALARELQAREIQTLEILRDNFGFDEKALQNFVDFKIKKMQKARQSKL